MKHHTIIAAFAALALASPLLAIGQRYLLPPATNVQLFVDEDPAAKGLFVLTGTATATTVGLAGGLVNFRLPPEVEAIGPVPDYRGPLEVGQAIKLTAKVKLKPGAKEALVGFGAAHDFDAAYWTRYVETHEKEYPSVVLRDHLVRMVALQKGKRVTDAKVSLVGGAP